MKKTELGIGGNRWRAASCITFNQVVNANIHVSRGTIITACVISHNTIYQIEGCRYFRNTAATYAVVIGNCAVVESGANSIAYTDTPARAAVNSSITIDGGIGDYGRACIRAIAYVHCAAMSSLIVREGAVH